MNHIGTRELTTSRLTLRRIEKEDAADAYYNWLSDPEVCRHLTWQPYQSVGQAEEVFAAWVEQYKEKNYYMWAIELNEREQPIGTISAVGLDERVDAVELGYCIGKEHWNKGYMTEAVREIIRFFFEEVGAARVWAEHDVNNPNSGKVMKAVGMTYEGTHRRAGRNNQGICDMAVYAVVREDLRGGQKEDAGNDSMIPVSGGEEHPKCSVTKVLGEDGIWRSVIEDETMEYVGILAKLELSAKEAQAAKKDMEAMLDYIDQLNELDTTRIEPMSHVFPIHNVFREDVIANGDGSEDTLSHAPLKKDHGFVVPKTIGE